MNITKIIEEHRAAQARNAASVQARSESIEQRAQVQKEILREKMRSIVYPLIQRFCEELSATNEDAHATHSEEERVGDELHSWVVCSVSLIVNFGGKRRKADLQFVGSVTPDNWKISAFHNLTGIPDADASPNFIGFPQEIEPFVTRETEAFLLALYPPTA